MTTTTNNPAAASTPSRARLPWYTCDSCRRRPGTWHASFDDGVAFDVCEGCVALVDDRVTLSRATVDHEASPQNGATQPCPPPRATSTTPPRPTATTK